ncbi:hypothetical protein RSSM_01612 [Rhodopirellula sallentina SM41]|uniref:Uncharacterized protein n=1 Tax=Rhodopirellula sallentina SM41 TaxID=1263870 RepID=M5UGG3_9BACT|nr:hypothetical protein RSSM_01612 [Rhodopirellula sallentina SM41]
MRMLDFNRARATGQQRLKRTQEIRGENLLFSFLNRSRPTERSSH